VCKNLVQKALCGDLAMQLEDLDKKLGECNENNEQVIKDLNEAVERANEAISERDQAVDALGAQMAKHNELSRVHSLMIEGPEPPPEADMRVLPSQIMQQLLLDRFGQIYTNALSQGAIKLSDGDWLTAEESHLGRYLEYYTEYWLPRFGPYYVLTWKKLDGTEVEIWVRNCDDWADFLHGLPGLHHHFWSGLPWGLFWGKVIGLLMAGYHAFNWHVCWHGNYDETSITGLNLFLIEPQKGKQWTVNMGMPVTVHEVVGLVPREVKGFYTVEEMSLIVV